jgi:hypothetical protein
VAHILNGPDLFAWCEHGTPLGHSCWYCRTYEGTAADPELPRRGWECPRCRRAWNPSVLSCHHCPEPPVVIAQENEPAPLEIGLMRYARVGREWTEILPGIQCDSDHELTIRLRLTPIETGP